MQRYFGEKRDIYGRVEPSASVSVFVAGTPALATIYNSADPLITPTVPKGNPFYTDQNGEYSFAAPDGVYDITVQGAGSIDYKRNLTLSATVNVNPPQDSSQITYLAPYTGAISRTMQSKASDTISLLDFGCDPTGTTDSYSKIVAALTAYPNVLINPNSTFKVSAAIVPPSNTRLFGCGPSSILKAATDGMTVVAIGSAGSRSNITLEDFAIDGGGQTSNTATGVKAVTGIYASNCSNIRINNITGYKFGVINSAAHQTDASYAGNGICVQSLNGPVSNVRVTNCSISLVAGGGIASGDAFYTAGQNANTCTDVVFENCWASTAGRHCYSASGTASLSSGIKFINCYGEKSGSSGVDCEDSSDVVIDNCDFKNCGNDQTYSNPAVELGATYRLLAGVATSSLCINITVSNCTFTNCYYGLNEGGGTGLIASNCIFNNSTVADVTRGLSGSTTDFRLSKCRLNSALDAFLFNMATAGGGFAARDCTFAGTVKVTAMADGLFDGCTFKKGFTCIGGPSGFARNKFIGCTFLDWAGIGIQCDSANYAHPDNIVEGCAFYGTGNMTSGIQFGNNSALRWQINGNVFAGQTTAGINQTLGNAIHTFDARGNSFRAMPIGININQGMNDTILEGNVFQGITNYCIYWASIGATMNNSSVINNVVGAGCTNGITISGIFDYCILSLNNTHAASGTKWSITGGQNANGVTLNNITT